MAKLSNNEASRKSEFSALMEIQEVQSWRAILAAFNAIFSKLEKGLKVEGCSLPRFQILLHLYFDGNLPAVEIARKMLVTRGNISMFLRRMESDGLIRKKLPPGQNRPQYSLSSKGQAFFEKIFPEHIQRVRLYAPVLEPRTLKQLLKCTGMLNGIRGK